MQDDPKIAGRKHERQVKQAVETAAGLTIAERLTRRAKAQTTELALNDEGGEFIISMRQPTRAEMEELQRTRDELKTEGTQDEANKRLSTMLGDLCTDTSLDYEFWMDGNYGMTDLIDIVDKLFESIVERVKAAQSFRKD